MDQQTDEFTVTLLSNASTDIFPNNTVFDFTNVLARTLRFPPDENWRVCLQSISLTTASDDPRLMEERESIKRRAEVFTATFMRARQKLNDPDNRVILKESMRQLLKQSTEIFKDRIKLFNETNTLFVECEEIIPQFGNKRYLSSFFIPPQEKIKGEFITFEPQTEEYFNLLSPEINQFSIKIRNTDGDKIYRSVAQPSIAVLKFKKMKNIRKSYSINITNGAQDPCHFFTEFPTLLVQDGQQNPWEMAVNRISFIPLFKKYPSGTFTITIIKNADDYLQKFDIHTWDEYLSQKEKGQVHFQYDNNYTTVDLLHSIDEVIKSAAKKIGLVGKLEQDEDEYLSIKIIPSQDQVATNTLKEEEKDVPNNIYLVILPEELIYVLGFDNDGIYFNNGYGAIPSTYKKHLSTRRKINESFLVPQNLLLYCDGVNPSLVGNVYGKYLTNIPIPREEQSMLNLPYILYEPKHLEFHSLQGSDVNHILFRLLKTDGTAPEFLVENIQIFISVLLREKTHNIL